MSEDNPATRRVVDSISPERRLPIVGIREGDLYVLVGFPIAGLLVVTGLGIDAMVLPSVAVGLALGVAVVYAAPAHRPAGSWLWDLGRFYLRRPRTTGYDPAHATTPANSTGETTPVPQPFVVDERTQELTAVERVWPGYGAIQRTDGTVEGFLELSPGNMDFALSDDWAQRQAVGEAFANQELDFRLTLHTTTEPYPAATLVDQLDERLADPAVTANEPLRALIAEYREQRPADLAETQQLRYFLGVEVAPFEVYERHPEERTPAERLTTLPVIGLLVTPFVTRRERLTEAELRGAQLEKLSERLRTVDTEFVAKTADWSARRLTTAELVGLTTGFWNGAAADAPAVATNVAVDHAPREGGDVE